MGKEQINKRVLTALGVVLDTHKELTKTAFAKLLGIKPQTFTEILKGRMNASSDIMALLTSNYGVSASWLLVGEGEMLNKEEHTAEQPSELQAPQPTGKPKPYTQEHPEVLKVCEPTAPPLTERLLDIIQQQAEEIGRIRQKLEQYEQSNGK